jgi:hypothetical protein
VASVTKTPSNLSPIRRSFRELLEAEVADVEKTSALTRARWAVSLGWDQLLRFHRNGGFRIGQPKILPALVGIETLNPARDDHQRRISLDTSVGWFPFSAAVSYRARSRGPV